jgi:hypothetical protein
VEKARFEVRGSNEEGRNMNAECRIQNEEGLFSSRDTGGRIDRSCVEKRDSRFEVRGSNEEGRNMNAECRTQNSE